MRKTILLGVMLVLTATSFVSCKKEYSCECEKIYTGSSGSYTYDDGIYTYKDTRARAEDRCAKNEETGTDLAGNYSRECEIK
ncbi:MAG: hypothetical protein M3R27_08315 [Bacteroidota bacterium]|nr:hypothetical protein [Bacteroidota bacterium]